MNSTHRNKGRFVKGFRWSAEMKKKMSLSRRGHVVSATTRAKISKSNKGRKPPQSAIQGRRKWVRENPYFQNGQKNPSWKGGIALDQKAYRKSRQYLYNFYQKRRAARQKNAEGTHTLADWETLKAQYNWTCPCCGRSEPIIKLTQDHIIPLIKGGSDNIENIQPLCQSCNSIKGTTTKKYER